MTLDAVISRFIDFHFRNNPSLATFYGYDHPKLNLHAMVEDFSKGALERRKKDVVEMVKSLDNIEPEDEDDEIDMEILRVRLDAERDYLDPHDPISAINNPMTYIMLAMQGLDVILSRMNNGKQDFQNLVERIELISRILEHGKQNLPLRPIGLYLKKAREMTDDTLAAMPAIFDVLIPECEERGYDGELKALKKLKGGIIESISSYKDFLKNRDQLDHVADKRYSLGSERYAGQFYKRIPLQKRAFKRGIKSDSPITPDFVLAEALRDFEKCKGKLVSAAEATGLSTRDHKEVLSYIAEREKENQLTGTFEEKKEFLMQIMKRVYKLVNGRLLDFEERYPNIEKTPGYLESLIPEFAYLPATKFGTPSPAVFNMTDGAIPFSTYKVELSVFHEGFHGVHDRKDEAHGKNLTRHMLRITSPCPFTSEGAALDMETQILHYRLYPENGDSARIVEGNDKRLVFRKYHLLRIARAIIEIRLHTGQYSISDARTFLQEEVGLKAGLAEDEAERAALSPLDSSSYYIGERVIKKLRRDFYDKVVAERKGADPSFEENRFKLEEFPKLFNEEFLSKGTIGLHFIRRMMLSPKHKCDNYQHKTQCDRH